MRHAPTLSSSAFPRAWARALRAALLLLACVGVTAAAPRKVILKLNWHHQFQFAGYYAAEQQGFYKEAGLDVEFQEPGVNEDPADAVLNGRADFGIGGSDLLQHWAEGRRVVVLAAIFQHTPQVILARPESGISSVHDLRGKRVMIESQSASLRAYLKAEGLTGSFLELPHSFGIQELIRGEVDAISAYRIDEPYELAKLGQAYLLFTPQAAGYDFYGDCLFTRESLISQDRAMVEAFRKASLAGWRYAMAHPQELVDWILEHHGTRHSAEHLRFEATGMGPLLQAEVVEMGYLNPGRWQHIAKTMAELGMVPQDLSLEGFLYDPNPRSALVRLQRMFAGALLVALCAGGLSFLFLRLNRRLREQIRQNAEIQAQFQSLLQNTTDAVFWVRRDEEGHFIAEDINPAEERTLGKRAEEVRGRKLSEVTTPEIVAMVEPRYRACLDTGMPQIYEESALLKGVTRVFETLLVPLADEHGHFRRLVGFSRDVTTTRQDQEQRRQGQKMESLVLMAGGIAHDFNNLFQAIQSSLEMARLNLNKMSIESCPFLDRAEAALGKASELSGALLNFSGKGFRAVEFTDLATLARQKVAELELEGPLGSVLSLDIPAELPPLELDPDQVGKVIVALLSNAFEALGEKPTPGAIRLRMFLPTTEAEEGFWVAPRPALDCLCLEVADAGPGIPTELQAQIFEPFYSTKRTGRGLGLPAALGILKAHSAGLNLLSQPGQGTRIQLYFPLHASAPPVPIALPQPTREARGSILVVDDETQVRQTLAELLQEVLHFPVIEARDGVEAIEQFEQHASEIALVLMDATMPRMGGMEAFSALRQRRPDLPGILCSGYGDEFGHQTATSHGFHSFLKKPFLIRDLKQAITEALNNPPSQ